MRTTLDLNNDSVVFCRAALLRNEFVDELGSLESVV